MPVAISAAFLQHILFLFFLAYCYIIINNSISYVDSSLLKLIARIYRYYSFQKSDNINTIPIKIKRKSATPEALPENGKISPSIVENTKASKRKEILYSSLLEASSYALMLMRTQNSRKENSAGEPNARFLKDHEEDLIVNNGILESLSSCLNMLNKGSKEILHIAGDIQKYLEMLKYRMRGDIANNIFDGHYDNNNVLSSKSKRKRITNRFEVNCIFD